MTTTLTLIGGRFSSADLNELLTFPEGYTARPKEIVMRAGLNGSSFVLLACASDAGGTNLCINGQMWSIDSDAFTRTANMSSGPIANSTAWTGDPIREVTYQGGDGYWNVFVLVEKNTESQELRRYRWAGDGSTWQLDPDYPVVAPLNITVDGTVYAVEALSTVHIPAYVPADDTVLVNAWLDVSPFTGHVLGRRIGDTDWKLVSSEPSETQRECYPVRVAEAFQPHFVIVRRAAVMQVGTQAYGNFTVHDGLHTIETDTPLFAVVDDRDVVRFGGVDNTSGTPVMGQATEDGTFTDTVISSWTNFETNLANCVVNAYLPSRTSSDNRNLLLVASYESDVTVAEWDFTTATSTGSVLIPDSPLSTTGRDSPRVEAVSSTQAVLAFYDTDNLLKLQLIGRDEPPPPPPTPFHWIFGDGATADTQHGTTTHTYTAAGSYLAFIEGRDGGVVTVVGVVPVTVEGGATTFTVTAVPDHGYVPLRTVITAADVPVEGG
jgi:hypothetical protein